MYHCRSPIYFLLLLSCLSATLLAHTRTDTLWVCQLLPLLLGERACGSVPACDSKANSSSSSPSTPEKVPRSLLPWTVLPNPFPLGPSPEVTPLRVFSLVTGRDEVQSTSFPPHSLPHRYTAPRFIFCFFFLPTCLFLLHAPSRDCLRWQEAPPPYPQPLTHSSLTVSLFFPLR